MPCRPGFPQPRRGLALCPGLGPAGGSPGPRGCCASHHTTAAGSEASPDSPLPSALRCSPRRPPETPQDTRAPPNRFKPEVPRVRLRPHRKQPAKCVFGNSPLPPSANRPRKLRISLHGELGKGLGPSQGAESGTPLGRPRARWGRRCTRAGEAARREENLATSEGRTGFSRGVPWEGARALAGQRKVWGLTGWFPWRLGRGGGMHPANCGETTGLPGRPGWRRRAGGRAGWGWGEAGRDGGGAVTCALGGEAPSRPWSEPSPAKWLHWGRTLDQDGTPWEDSRHRRPGPG